MKKLLIVLILTTIMSGCNRSSGDVVEGAGVEHLVFLSIRDDLRPSEIRDLKSHLQKLEEVEGVIKLTLEERSDIGDDRALNYDMLLKVWLKDLSALKTYDQDSLHNEIRQVIFAHLDKAPATFDIVD